MIACPACGAETRVMETRATGYGARRRRICTDVACGGRVTTLEVAVQTDDDERRNWDGPLVLVPASDVEELRRVFDDVLARAAHARCR